MFRIKFYKDKNGFAPIAEYIKELRKKSISSKSEKVRLKKITEYLERLTHYGTKVGEPYVKHIDGKIYELRPTNDRIFFFAIENNTFVMLHHFVKKSSKTPKREIEQAKRNLADFIKRRPEDE